MKRLVALVAVAAMMVVATAMPVLAAPVAIGGLVTVVIVDAVDVENNTVRLPIGVAANVCDVNAAVLVAEFQDDGGADGGADCEATADAVANAPGPPNG